MNRDEMKGITPRKCPDACTPERCVISTVGVCKHPSFTSDSGCGPITMANRELARKVVKISLIEGEGDAVDTRPVRQPAQQEAEGRRGKKGRVHGKRNAPGRRAGRRGHRNGEQARQPDAEQARKEEGMTDGQETVDR